MTIREQVIQFVKDNELNLTEPQLEALVDFVEDSRSDAYFNGSCAALYYNAMGTGE